MSYIAGMASLNKVYSNIQARVQTEEEKQDLVYFEKLLELYKFGIDNFIQFTDYEVTFCLKLYLLLKNVQKTGKLAVLDFSREYQACIKNKLDDENNLDDLIARWKKLV